MGKGGAEGASAHAMKSGLQIKAVGDRSSLQVRRQPSQENQFDIVRKVESGARVGSNGNLCCDVDLGVKSAGSKKILLAEMLRLERGKGRCRGVGRFSSCGLVASLLTSDGLPRLPSLQMQLRTS